MRRHAHRECVSFTPVHRCRGTFDRVNTPATLVPSSHSASSTSARPATRICAHALAILSPGMRGMSGNRAGASGERGGDTVRLDQDGSIFCCSDGLSRRSILADWRSLETNSVCALRERKELDLIPHLPEFRRLFGAFVLQLDDVPTELRLDGIGDLARIHFECHSANSGTIWSLVK